MIYTIAAGHGIGTDVGEPVNAGFKGSGPMSSGIDLRAYQGADGVYVGFKPFAAEMIRMSLAGITLAFDSLPDRDYEIQWTTRLGADWQTVTNVPSQGERTRIIVVHPDPTSPTGFFRIRLK